MSSPWLYVVLVGGWSSGPIFHLEAEGDSRPSFLYPVESGWARDLSSANPVVSPRTLILKLMQGQERTGVGHWNLNRLFQLQNSCSPPIFGSPEFLGPFPFSTMLPQNHSNSLFILARVRSFLHSYRGTKEITEEEESIWDDWWFHIHLGRSPL